MTKNFALASAFAGFVTLGAAGQTMACTSANPVLCGPIAPEGHEFSGNQDIPLDQTVRLCHPNWDNLARKWYSYAIFTDGQLNQLIRSLKRSGSWNQEVELPEGQRCHDRFYGSNWMFAVYDPCVVEGHNVLRIGRPSPGGTIDSFDEWPIVAGEDGKPMLFPL